MCSYNSVAGIPACANGFLMQTIARSEWGFDGYVTSDCAAVTDILETHNYTTSVAATFGATLPRGLDIGCDMLLVTPGAAEEAIAQGIMAESDIDSALAHLLRVRMRLGDFDAAAGQPYRRIGLDVVCSPEHIALARESARQSLVLLSNPRGLLPLDRGAISSVAIIGTFGNSTKVNGGKNYAGIPCGGRAVTVADAFVAAGLRTTVVPGCADIACVSTSGFAAATAAAAAADAAVVVMGIDETIEDEGLDRVQLTLPGQGAALVGAACAAAKVCIVVIMSGGGIDLSSVEPAISGGLFQAGFLGGSGAPALVDTVFGLSSPAGRLTQTHYPAHFVDDVSMFDMGMRPGPSDYPPGTSPGRTYSFYTGTPVHAFGAGLTYTTWSVAVDGPRALPLQPVAAYLAGHRRRLGALYSPLDAPEVARYRANVTNTGDVDSDYVVLGFLVPPGAGTGGAPLQTLFGFERVHVKKGETVSVWLGVSARDLTRVSRDAAGELARRPAPGAYTLRVGVEGADEVARFSFVLGA